ncbi:hypothetical protein [Actinocorallia longicatena]|uniref:DNA-directed RNA polymerase specialized sigma24 family protein n=1 Tax=Actinocorallia longicatena TaxID=111803 RepID=A0ABP6QFC4_9ACTN
MRSIKSSRVPVRPYRELVWLAYLTLPAGGDAERRLVLAHRLAAAEFARHERSAGEPPRRRYVRRLLRQRMRPWSGRLASVGAMPALTHSVDVAFTEELDALPAPARAAYALLRLEERPPEEVVAILAGAGVADPGEAIDAVTRLEERAGDGAAHRPALDPTLARMYGRPGLPRPRTVAVAALCGLSVLAAVTWSRLEPHGHADALPELPRAARALPDAWRGSTELDLSTWPARGALADDGELVGRAMRAWGSGPAQLLYAGRVDGVPVVLLHRPGQVARYTEDGGGPPLEVLPQPRTKPDGASPLKLRTTAEGGRYLLPPWVREVSASDLSGADFRWRKIAVREGVTGPIARADGRGCWRGPVLRLRAPEIAHGMPYTMLDFGRLSLSNAYYQPPPPADVNRFGPGELDTVPGGFSAWKALGCAVDRPGGEIQGATAWEFWSGALPERGRGRWLCLRLTDATGGSSVRAVLLATAAGRTTTALTRTATNTWDCSRLRRDLVAGAWWKAPSGKRYYVAGASRRVIGIRLSGRDAHAREVISDRRLGAHPGLSAVNELGDTVPALQ